MRICRISRIFKIKLFYFNEFYSVYLAYEVELTNEEGETLDILPLNSEEFVVVWRAETQEWVPVAEQTASILKRLPENIAKEVLDFACFLSLKHHLGNRQIHFQVSG
jgi:hypothetical protein